MKKSLLIMVMAFITGVVTASATCWRINPSPYAGAQFKTVEEAMNDLNVIPGDTLLLDPGSHGDISVTRENMTVIGSGYFLSQNKQWGESRETILGSVNLTNKCKLEGCSTSYIYADGTQITISRCKSGAISVGTENIVERCLFSQIQLGYGSSIIRNNIILNSGEGGSGWNVPIYGASGQYGNGSIIENNTIVAKNSSNIIGNVYNSTIRNNIVINYLDGFDSNQVPFVTKVINFESGNNVILNNIFSTPAKYANAQFPYNYFVGAAIENTFVNEGSEDAKWQLLDTSVAKGAATHGGDCGAFGGPTPYVLSGIPQFLPHITGALIPAKPTDGKITVKLKIANQNE